MYILNAEKLGLEFEEATVSFWHYNEGDSIKKDEPLLELMSAKAVIIVESPIGGVLKKCIAKIDDTVNVNSNLCEIE